VFWKIFQNIKSQVEDTTIDNTPEEETNNDDMMNEGQLDLFNDKSKREYTPENITSLKPNEVFVFGSNAEGVHGKGAALLAKQKFGAIQGQSEGLQGQSYAVITKKNWRVQKSSTLTEIEDNLHDMIMFANENPNKKFLVTKLGSSLAGYNVQEIKNIFQRLYDVIGITDNVILPKEYEVREDLKDDINNGFEEWLVTEGNPMETREWNEEYYNTCIKGKK